MNPRWLRLSAMTVLFGLLFFIFSSLFHVDGHDANDHLDSFTLYASSSVWTLAHLGQFVGRAIILSGLLGLFFALDNRSVLARFAAISAVVTLGLYGVLQAVDGVALKQAVDAWAGAPEAQKAARYASAEAMRWLEWGVRSYESLMMGLTLLLFGIVIAQVVKIPKPIGYLMGLSGLAYAAQGWVIAAEGFSGHNAFPTLLGYISVLVWSVWLLVATWPRKMSPQTSRG